MLSKMSKSDKTMFYYLGLSLLVLIVLGVLFGISSVKESFGKGRTTEEKACKAAGKNHAKGMFGSDTPAHAAGLKWKKPLKNEIVNKIKSRCNDEWGSGSRTQKPGRAMTAARMAARISSAQQYGIQEGARIVNDLLPRGVGIISLDPETDGDLHYN